MGLLGCSDKSKKLRVREKIWRTVGPLPGHAVVGCSEAKGGAEGVGLWRAGAPSCGHCHGLVIHHTAVLAALGEEGRYSEGLG